MGNVETEEPRPVVTVDLASLPVFPRKSEEWFDDAVWQVTTSYAEAIGVDPFDPQFEELFKAAVAVAELLPDMGTLIAAAAAVTLQDWCMEGAVEFSVPTSEGSSTEQAETELRAMIVSMSTAACATAIFCGIRLLTGARVDTVSPALVEFPLTVR